MKQTKLLLYGAVPSKKNSRVINKKTGKSFPNKAYTGWKKECKTALLSQIPNYLTEEPHAHCAIKIVFTMGDKRVRDVDNAVSSLLDMLTDYKVLNEDNWRVVSELHILAVYEPGIFKTEIQIDEKQKGVFEWLWSLVRKH